MSRAAQGGGERLRRNVARVELLAAGVCFGLMAVLARLLSRGPGAFTAGHLSAVRFAVGALVSLFVFWVRPALYRPRNHRLLFSRGVTGGLVVVLYFMALSRIPAGEAGLLYSLFPVIATAMSLFAFGERPTLHLWLALAIASAGVVLVLGQGTLSPGIGSGELLALGAAVFAAASANIIRGMRGTDNAPTIFFFFCLVGLPVALPFALDPWPSAPAPWLLALAMGLSAFAAQVLMTEAYGALSVPEAAVWLQVTPIAQYLLALPLLGEPVSLSGMAGVLLGVAGVAYGSVLGHRPPPSPGAAAAKR